MITDAHILRRVCEFFVRSRDFNGIPARDLVAEFDVSWPDLQELLRRLLRSGRISLTFASHSENPHIKRLPDLPLEVQLAKVTEEDIGGICVYPDSDEIANISVLREYDDRPYALRLALAEPQLIPIYFELNVLEKYFRDPRYSCRFGDSHGSISVSDEAYFSERMAERDKISLQSFGIGYDQEGSRVVVVFLRYLSDLSPEHQQAWKSHEIPGLCKINSDYERASIWGAWPKYYSVYAAFIQEQVEINKLSLLIGKVPLFKDTYEDHRRPLGFSSMLRPTSLNFDEFVHLLDKMLSDNMDRKFFQGDIPLEERITRRDGTIEIQQLGTITMLERWLKRHYKTRDGEDVSREVVAPFREVRSARQPSAHDIGQNAYDLTLPRRQDEILGDAKQALTKLRWILSSHPMAKGYEAPEWLDGDKIVFY